MRPKTYSVSTGEARTRRLQNSVFSRPGGFLGRYLLLQAPTFPFYPEPCPLEHNLVSLSIHFSAPTVDSPDQGPSLANRPRARGLPGWSLALSESLELLGTGQISASSPLPLRGPQF